MNESILKASKVTKNYGTHAALNNVSLEIKRGMIYGLIGENGAGKSTFMRVVMGLISSTSGEIELFGKSGAAELQKARRRMGQSIETPALYPDLTAYENLRVQAANGGVGENEIENLLEMMNLQDTGKKKVKNFSLGMRQRLAIAVTLITHPEFLILDEPTNGLDPAGIVEMREIIQRLVSERGITVLLSSHLLDELSQVATHYGILHNGKLIREFSREELENETRRYIDVEVDQPDKAIVVLEKLGINEYEVTTSSRIRVYQALERAAELNKALVMENIAVSHLAIANQKLEDYFLQLTGGVQHV